MIVIFLLIGISLCIAGGALAAFIWAVNGRQYEDTYTPSIRILIDDSKQDYHDQESN
ncbi:MAG: cbb3-type cytochrome oxidase assembly protein CcoS [Bacteroidetes bacterium]|nr:MAG: cbb3-type cytochrome oxidase assembly protein CcoS [Bacteroidota bacterium]